jgi:hypothetical protein
MSGPMEKTLSRSLEAVADQQTAMSTQRTNFIPAHERKDAETATRMRIRRIW